MDKSRSLLAIVVVLLLLFMAAANSDAQENAAPEGSCASPNPKKMLIATTTQMWELFAAGQDHLCNFEPGLYYDRSIGTATVGAQGLYRQLPFVRSSANLSTFCNSYGSYDGVVLFGDAPTRTVAQGGTYQTAEQTGDLALALNDCAPNARLAGPFSDLNVMTGADGVPSDWLYRMQQRYINNGGDLTKWTDAGLLMYPDRFAGQHPESMLQNYSARMLYVTSGHGTANVYVETRWGNSWANPAYYMEDLMDRFMGQSVVQYVFGFHVDGSSLYKFRAPGGALTGSGTGYRNSGW